MSVGAMKQKSTQRVWKGAAAVFAVATVASGVSASAQGFGFGHGGEDRVLLPGNLVVSRSVYDNNPNNVKVGTVLPPGCSGTTGGCSAPSGAPDNGAYPAVFNNVIYDPSFGITSRIFLDQITPYGRLLNSIEVPNSLQYGVRNTSNQLVTSFSSKSEIALNLSTDGKYLTFMGYVAPVNTIDVSNSNTPDAVDGTNPVGQNFFRAVATLDSRGRFTFTETNAYSGNNGRAAILNNSNGANFFYTTGNAGNGSNPQPSGVVLGAGAQIIDPSLQAESKQTPGLPTPVGSFSVTELPKTKADKIGKDDNFRGLTIFDNVLYYSKGSGSNGVNTVYFLDTTGTACPNGVGVPSPSATLPTTPLAAPSDPATDGLPSNMCILAGFPAIANKSQTTVTAFPFGIWFADTNTVYVADEGSGDTSSSTFYATAAAQTTAGLQKWIYNSTTKTWSLAYTLQTGLELGKPYTVRGYPTGTNAATGLPWAPATDGLRNITGQVNHDGTVTIWAITSTVSGGGDTGADPNKLLAITDELKNTSAPAAAKEQFVTLREAGFGEVLRGVSFTPETETASHDGGDNHGRGW